MAFISPWHLSGDRRHAPTVHPNLSACAEPSSAMGNCQPGADPFFSIDKNSSTLTLGDDFGSEWNESYEPFDYSDSNLEAAAPCHSCSLLDDSSLPFFIVASIVGILASGLVLFALLRPLFHWNLCPGRPILVQLAVGSGLFSVVVPILAPGLGGSQNSALCYLGHWVWYGSAFAQALLIGCRAGLGPRLSTCQVPRLTVGLTVGLWTVAALLVLPITLASDISPGICTLKSNKGLGTLQYIHAATCFAIFSLLPLGLVVAKGLKMALGKGPGPWVDILWVWFIFWCPHGVMLVIDSLVRSSVLVLSTCGSQQVLDLLLHGAEALAILHCVATPLLLAFFCYQTTHRSLPPGPLPARWPHPDIPEIKS
ncbi:atypical chemokine receptor 1 [Echinops telfairi]|uniref:Atypical chemokine receptor 1 n=1 Tax=Echinops telfairi TaxID=9371 RepID=A0ABM0J4V0_ECHTE|nr:atypical chemokine receptor 1 [Echinops telfairi]